MNVCRTVFFLMLVVGSTRAESWKKHIVMERGHCNTAVALDADGKFTWAFSNAKNVEVALCPAPYVEYSGCRLAIAELVSRHPIKRTPEVTNALATSTRLVAA